MSEIKDAAYEIMRENRPELDVCSDAEVLELGRLRTAGWLPATSLAVHLCNKRYIEQAGDYEVQLYKKYGIDPFVYPLRLKRAPCPKCKKIGECSCDYRGPK